MAPGVMVISLDFEAAWGLRRRASDDPRCRGVERVREVVRGLLDIFARHGISATWATVGAMMVRPGDCVDGHVPITWPAPRYPWFHGGWLDGIPAIDAPGAGRFFAPDVIEALVSCPVYQEIGAHTFTHVMVGHPACTADIARAELEACQRVAARWGRRLESVVFPWNRQGHLPVLEELGYRCYRALGNEWYWLGRTERLGTPLGQPLPWRAARTLTLPLRYLDERLRVCPPLPPARRVGRLWEIPHSMFFPGFHGVARFVSVEDRCRRAIKGLHLAADRERIFSLYTHPESFLPDPTALLAGFARVCREAAALRDAGVLQILTMGQVAADLTTGRRARWEQS